MKKRKLKRQAELEADIAAQQIQNKRFHQKVKLSGKSYNRQESKRKAQEEEADD